MYQLVDAVAECGVEVTVAVTVYFKDVESVAHERAGYFGGVAAVDPDVDHGLSLRMFHGQDVEVDQVRAAVFHCTGYA